MVPLYRGAVGQIRWLPGPRVLANSLPKAGTHLLTGVLQRLPRLVHSGRHLRWRDYAPLLELDDIADVEIARLERDIMAIRRGQIASAHFPYVPNLDARLLAWGVSTIAMVRDPRDAVVSLYYYALKRSDNPLHERYRTEFSSPDAGLMASITGFAPKDGDDGLLPLAERLRLYDGWHKAEGVLTCRFEDLIGAKGGGSSARQLETVRAIAAHVSRPLTDAQAAQVVGSVWSPRSATFRAGRTRDWERHFSAEHMEVFEEVAGDYLRAWGYE